MELIFILLIVLAVAYKLGLFGPIIDLSDVASRESSAYNREHKVKVAKRYEAMTDEFDVEKVNANITKIDALKFD
jgi:hypothetical protein